MINDIKQIPTDRSITIISSPRTGSTALCYRINPIIPCFFEIFNPIDNKEEFRQNFWSNYDADYLWSCKIFPQMVAKYQINNKPVIILGLLDQKLDPLLFDKLSNKSRVFVLKRKDIVGQITSHYIMNETNKTYYSADESIADYTVDINEDRIDYIVKLILNCNIQANKFVDYSEDVIYYEDIKDSLNNHRIQPTINPKNYNDVRQQVEKQLKRYV